jgi:hypothetical protein
MLTRVNLVVESVAGGLRSGLGSPSLCESVYVGQRVGSADVTALAAAVECWCLARSCRQLRSLI